MIRHLPESVPEDTKPFGTVRVPGSKAVTQRLLVLGALAPGTTCIRNPLRAEDTGFLRDAIVSLGLPVEDADGAWRIQGGRPIRAGGPIDLGASGAALRFLLPLLALRAVSRVEIRGEERLFQRPLGPLLDLLESLGARWHAGSRGGVLEPVANPPNKLEACIDAFSTSQFLTGLAMTAASLPEGGRLRWSGPSASASYLRLTATWMERFGCATRLADSDWEIPGGRLRPIEASVPCDWSAAASFLCAAALTGRTATVLGLDPADPQGDRILLEILCAAGCTAKWNEAAMELHGPLVSGLDADLRETPDLAPVLGALAACAPGPSSFSGLEGLKGKECDRLDATAGLARWLGAEAEVEGSGTLRIRPGSPPGVRPPFDPRNDHRMAFAAALGALRCGGEVMDPACVAKSYPGFWEDWDAFVQGTA